MNKRTIRRSAARKGRTDWAALKRKSEAEIRKSAAADPDAGMTPDAWWKHARVVRPGKSKTG